jgi:hypothetical protein
MGRKFIYSVLALAISTSIAMAEEEKKDESGVFGQVRLGYINTDDNVTDVETLAIGGKLGYTSPTYRGMSAGAVFYTSNPLGGLDSDGFFLDSNNDGYSILGEAWVNADIGKTSVKLGRQLIDTPFADTDDIGMIQNSFEGIVITNHSVENTEFFAAHLSRWAGVDSPTHEKFVKLDNNHGVNVLGVNYEVDKWGAQLWYYDSKDGTDIAYADVSYRPMDAVELGLQYADQNDTTAGGTGSDGTVWGATASYSINDVTVAIDHNQVSGKGVTNGFGGGPFYTSGIDHTIADVKDQRATAVGIEYTGLKDWTLGVRKINFDKGEDTLDIAVAYQVRKNLHAGLEHADMDNDGTITKAFLNFDF